MAGQLSTSLYPFELRDQDHLEDEQIISCYLGKIVHFWRGRNAYWGTRSSTYPGYESFLLKLSDAKRKIEARRERGSQWRIEELPVIVVAGRQDALVVGEINTNEPLSAFLPFRVRNIGLLGLGEYFSPRRLNSVFRFTCRTGLVVPAQLPFLEYKSLPLGGNTSLRWPESLAETKLDSILHLIQRINKCLQRK